MKEKDTQLQNFILKSDSPDETSDQNDQISKAQNLEEQAVKGSAVDGQGTKDSTLDSQGATGQGAKDSTLKSQSTRSQGVKGQDVKDHPPRPVKPEDESYGELMMRFTAHPVKPKYWFEEFGDHWTCSCGQINKGASCANCGLERDLLRKLFILHKPSPDGQPVRHAVDPSLLEGQAGKNAIEGQISFPSGSTGDRFGANGSGLNLAGSDVEYAGSGDGISGHVGRDNAGSGTSTIKGSGSTAGAANASDSDSADEIPSHRGLVIGIIVAALLLLLGTGAFLYFVIIPEMQEQDAARQDSVRMSLSENLPVAAAPLPKAQYRSYVAAGDALCDKGRFRKAMTYYDKAADLKDDDSIQQKILDAKFGYVKAHRDKGDGYFETYLNELVDKGYDGSRAIYDSYYAWNVSIVANNIKDDFSTEMKSVNRSDTIYFHTTVTGGPPGDALRLYYQIIWPDGTAETKDVDSTWSAGSHFSSRFQYAMPLFSKPGKLTFELYDKDSHDLLGTESIKLTK